MSRYQELLGSVLQTLATDGPRARAAIGATSPLTTVGCTLIFLLVLSVLTRLLRPKVSQREYEQHTVDPDSLLFADDDLPALRPDQLKSAIAALKQHAREHALLEAGALLRQVRRAVSTAPHTPAARASRAALEGEIVPGLTADELAQRHAECLHTLQILDPSSPATGWRELSSHDDMTSCYVRRSADGAVWAKATAELRGVRLADLVTIFRQTELFDRWYPRCVASENLKVPGAVERLFRMVVQVRVPLIGAICYDLVPHAYGVDALQARGAMLMCGRSAHRKDWPELSAHWPKPPDGGFRQELNALRLMLQPTAGGGVYAAIALSIKLPEAHAALLPGWVIDWLVCKLTGQIFTEQVAQATRMRAEPSKSEHLRAVAADPEFYEGWLAPRVTRATQRAESGVSRLKQ